MASLGKKILSAFVEVSGDNRPAPVKPVVHTTMPATINTGSYPAPADEKFTQYFDKLFSEANIPGPDYYEFSKMITAMRNIPDELARFMAAFAGLSVQGLDKQKLLTTAAQYVQLLDDDAAAFHASANAALQEKVHGKKREVEEITRRMQALSREIGDLQNRVAVLHREIKENEEKIESGTGGYKAASINRKNRILDDIEKIKQYIH